MSGAKFDPDTKFEQHGHKPLTHAELIQAIREFQSMLANVCFVLKEGYVADTASQEGQLWLYISDALAAVLFTLTCSTKVGCDKCDDKVRGAGTTCVLRLNAMFDKAYKNAKLQERQIPEPPEGSPIN